MIYKKNLIATPFSNANCVYLFSHASILEDDQTTTNSKSCHTFHRAEGAMLVMKSYQFRYLVMRNRPESVLVLYSRAFANHPLHQPCMSGDVDEAFRRLRCRCSCIHAQYPNVMQELVEFQAGDIKCNLK